MAAEPLIDDMNKAQLFFEKGSGGKEVYIDYDVCQQIIDLLISQAGKESDPKTCEEIYTIVKQLRLLAFDIKSLSEKLETDAGEVEVLDYKIIDKKTRQKLLKIFKEDAPKFVPLLQGPVTNELACINSRLITPEISPYTGEGKISTDKLTIFLDNYNNLTKGLDLRTQMLLDFCTMVLTEQNNYRGDDRELNSTVYIPLERFMELCGIPLTKASKDKTRREVQEDLETLYHVSLEWTENSGRNIKDYEKMRICSGQGIKKGVIKFDFSIPFAKYLVNSYVMQYPLELLKIDKRNPACFYIGRKIALHHSMYNNKLKGTDNIISVKSLLDDCLVIPTYEQVKETDRHLNQRIIAPFEKALNNLKFIRCWEYCNSKGAPLTEEQLQAMNYSTFIKLYIKFDVLGAPDQTARLKARAEEAKAQAEKKKRRTSKKKAEETT